jgi:prepilin-type N-terminal cleavage/methylation domain-containing protein
MEFNMLRKKGFTLIELLVVISIIALLLSILLPALSRARKQANKVLCATNLHQWALAIHAYAADNNNQFPYNGEKNPGGYTDQQWRPASGLAWQSSVVIDFWQKYLFSQLNADTIEKENDVLFCPTEKHHRALRAIGSGLCGYNVLPGRAANQSAMNWQPYQEPTSTVDWVTRKTLGSRFSSAPIVVDVMLYLSWQGHGWFNGFPGLGFGDPLSNHPKDDGEPEGGNFLFEDGRVEWHQFSEVKLGCLVGYYEEYYKIWP